MDDKRILTPDSLKLPGILRKSLRRLATKVKLAKVNPLMPEGADLFKGTAPVTFTYPNKRVCSVELTLHSPRQYTREVATIEWVRNRRAGFHVYYERVVAIVEYYLVQFAREFFWFWSEDHASVTITRRHGVDAQRIEHVVLARKLVWGLKLLFEQKMELFGPRPWLKRRRRSRRVASPAPDYGSAR